MKNGFATSSNAPRVIERIVRFPGKTGKGKDITQHVCVDPGASWRADFSETRFGMRPNPDFHELASSELAIDKDVDQYVNKS